MKNPIEYYQKVLQTNPGDVNTQLRLAAAWRNHGRDDLALDLYVSACRALVRKGWALQAAAACKNVLEIDPTHRETIEILDTLAASSSGSVAQVAAVIAASSRRKRNELESLGLVPTSRPSVVVPDGRRHSAKTVEIPFGPIPREPQQQTAEDFMGADTIPAGLTKPSLAKPEAPLPEARKSDRERTSARRALSTDTINYALSPDERVNVMEAMAREMEAQKRELRDSERPTFRSVHEQLTVVGPPPTPLAKPQLATRPNPFGLDATVDGLSQIAVDLLNAEPTGRANVAQTIVAHVPRAAPTPPPPGGGRIERAQQHLRVTPSGPRAIPTAPALPSSVLLDGVPWDVTQEVIERLRIRSVPDGASVTDHFSRQLVFVVSGHIDVEVKDKDGADRIAARLGPGDYFGETPILTGKAPIGTASAHGPCQLLVIPESDVSSFAEYDGALWDKLWHRHDQMVLDTALSRSNLFGNMSLYERRRLAGLFERYDVEKDQLIIGQGESGHGMYLVLRGAVEVTRKTSDGERVLGVLSDGKFFGTIKATASKATVRATCTSSLFVLVRESLTRALEP
jgi:CRP-like cAMP-binding protein